MDNDEKLTTVHVSFADGDSESLWAREIEGDLFAINNVPFVALGLNFGDIVRATPHAGVLEVRAVVRPSGHRTLRIVFGEHVTNAEQERYLDALRELGGGFERGTERLVAVNVPPDAQYDAMLVLLDRCEAGGVLAFETCEVRRAGSFDDFEEERAA